MRINTVDGDGTTNHIILTGDLVRLARGLPYEIEWYFTLDEGSSLIELDKLVQSRASAEGIANAVVYMRKAYDGEIDRRAPILVKENGCGTYMIVDGNSTATVAKAAGWPALICKVVGR